MANPAGILIKTKKTSNMNTIIGNPNTVTATSGSMASNNNQSYNKVEEINKDLVENNITYNPNTYQWEQSGETIKTNTLINDIMVKRMMLGKREIPEDSIAKILQHKIDNITKNAMNDFRAKVKFNPLAKDTFEDLALMITQDCFHHLYPDILRHIVWTVKRRVNNLPDRNPVFLNIYGEAGAGKTQFLKAFFSVMPECKIDLVKDAGELFNKDNQAFRFTDKFVCILDELSGLDKACICKIKNQIDATSVTYRLLYKQITETGKNNAQLIGTSNTRLQNTLYTDSDLRKWCELDFYKYPDNEVSNKMVQPLLDFDWLNLWQSIDENGLSPFHNDEKYKEFKAWTSQKCITVTPTVEFITSYIAAQGDEFVPANVIWGEYTTQNPEKNMSKSKFKELLVKYGFKEHRKKDCRGYNVPTVAQCKYSTDEEKAIHNEKNSNN